jgi:hypothetical protein
MLGKKRGHTYLESNTLPEQHTPLLASPAQAGSWVVDYEDIIIAV